MSKSYQVTKSCLRYVVPFFYEGDFEKVFRSVEERTEPVYKKNKETGKRDCVGERRLWVRKLDTHDRSERDLYDYVRTEFSFEEAEGMIPEEKSGCEWLFWRSKNAKDETGQNTTDGQKILDLRFYPESVWGEGNELSTAFKDFFVSSMGLYLFRNHVGFIWYEAEFSGPVSSEELILFQHNFQELNKDTYFFRRVQSEPEFGLAYHHEVKNSEGQIFAKIQYVEPFMMGHWLEEQLASITDLDFRFAAERRCAYPSVLNDLKKQATKRRIPFIGMEKEVAMTGEKYVPDKALLFTYCSFGNEETFDITENRKLTYYLTNGYKRSYLLSDEVAGEMKQPFANAFWFATQEGASYLVWPDEENKSFFDGNIVSKIRGDYFALYMKVLFQSYTLLYYATKIQKEISVEVKGGLHIDDKITELFEEINLFLTKSMTTSVSNIHHQSEFYLYLKRQLRIHEDVESVTSGINALDSLQREKRQKEDMEQERKAEREEKRRDAKVQAGVGLISVLAIASALTDAFDFISKFSKDATDGFLSMLGSPWLFAVMVFVLGLVGIVGGYAAICAWRALKESYKKDEEDETNCRTHSAHGKKTMLILVLVLLWTSLFVTDFVRVSQFEKPAFCVLINGADDGGSGTYMGLGYTVEIEGDFVSEDIELRGVTQYDMKLLGIFRVQAAIT